MAGTAQIVYSSGTITLQNSAATPALDFTYTPQGAPSTEDYVTEKASLRIRWSGTQPTFGSVIGSINRAFQLARKWEIGDGGDRVYLYLQSCQKYHFGSFWCSLILLGVKP